MKKLVRGLGVTVLAVAVLYYVGVNALLATKWGELLINQKPELAQVHYSRAWTIVPLRVEVRDFQLSMQDRLVQIMITADKVHGNLHPWTLLEGRFVATEVDAEGVTMRVRPRMDKGDALEKYIDELPPIAGYETALRDVSSNEVQAKDIRFLSLEFKDLKVKHLRELWIDRTRYTGDADVSGGMLYEPFRRLRIEEGRFTDVGGTLKAAAPNEVKVQNVDVWVDLPEISLSAMDFATMRGLMAQVKLSASADPRFLNSYLTNGAGLSSLSVSGADGQLELDVKIARGIVEDGGKLSYRSRRVAVRLPLVEVFGAAAVTGKVAEGRMLLDVDITRAALQQRDGQELLSAERFSLNTISPADITQLVDLDAVITLKGGKLAALTPLNQFIPEGAGVLLAGGTGSIDGSMRLDSVPPRARGEFELVASDVTLKNRSSTITGKLLVSAKLRSLNLNTGAMDLSGSTIAVEAATLQTPGRSWSHLWLRAVADPCLLTPKEKVLWSAKVAVGSSNLQPLLAIVSANVPIPGILSVFTDSPNVRVESTLLVRADRIELPRFTLNSQNVRVEGALTLREASATDPRLEPWGSVIAQFGALSAGVQLDGPKVSVVFGDLQRWAAGRKQIPTRTVVR